MPHVACSIFMSLDGFVAGENQTFERPFGHISDDLLHRWMFDEPEKHEVELNAFRDSGAFIMGGNMFGPKDRRMTADWKGWWGDDPPFHVPVFVLSSSPRESVVMAGGTTFHFVTDGIQSALAQALAVAGDKRVTIAGGAKTVNQYFAARLIDELWLHIVPVTVGSGARLFEGVPNLELEPLGISGTKLVTHVHYRVVKK